MWFIKITETFTHYEYITFHCNNENTITLQCEQSIWSPVFFFKLRITYDNFRNEDGGWDHCAWSHDQQNNFPRIEILRAKRASFRRMPTVQSKAPKDIQPCMHPSSNKARTPEGPSPGFDGVVLRPQFGPRRCSKVNTIQVREKRWSCDW